MNFVHHVSGTLTTVVGAITGAFVPEKGGDEDDGTVFVSALAPRARAEFCSLVRGGR
jgi:hypothetical protein